MSGKSNSSSNLYHNSVRSGIRNQECGWVGLLQPPASYIHHEGCEAMFSEDGKLTPECKGELWPNLSHELTCSKSRAPRIRPKPDITRRSPLWFHPVSFTICAGRQVMSAVDGNCPLIRHQQISVCTRDSWDWLYQNTIGGVSLNS